MEWLLGRRDSGVIDDHNGVAARAVARSDETYVLEGPVVAAYSAPATGAPLAVSADRRAAAFFDVDNTMLRGASLYWFARGMATRDYIKTSDLLRFAWSQLKFRLLAAEIPDDMASARAAALTFVKGWPVSKLETLSEEIFDELMAERIWSGTHALAQLHQAAGERVWLVTAAPVELGRVIANRLGLTGALGTIAEIEDGVYTGRLVGDLLHGPAKAVAIKELAEMHGLDLSECTAYSDSINDVPMLSAVGYAVAVNPDPRLRREARRRGWETRDFRTARKAAKIAVPAALGLGVIVGAAATATAFRRRR